MVEYEDIEKYLDQICSGRKIVEISGVPLVFVQPSMDIRIKSRYIYQRDLDAAIMDGVPTNRMLEELIKNRELVSSEDLDKLQKLKTELEAQKVLLAKTTKVKARQDKIKEIIKTKSDEVADIEYKQRAIYAMSAESKAEESRILYLCWACSYNFFTDELYWATHEVFYNDSNFRFRNEVVNNFVIFYSGIPTDVIRAIARSNLWRIKYVTSMKTSEQLFGLPVAAYSNDMVNLSYWSQFYQNIFEMMPEDRPNDLIIEDDEALDAYMKDYYDEKEKDSHFKKGKKAQGKLSAYNQNEVIVTMSDPMYEHAEYDTPREAQRVKDKAMINKRTRRG